MHILLKFQPFFYAINFRFSRFRTTHDHSSMAQFTSLLAPRCYATVAHSPILETHAATDGTLHVMAE